MYNLTKEYYLRILLKEYYLKNIILYSILFNFRGAVDLMNFSREEMEVLSFINHTKLSGIKQTENDSSEHLKISGNGK